MSIKLEKGNKINLTKNGQPGGDALNNIFMGLGWDVASGGLFGGGSIDLDASCAMLDENGNLVDKVWFGQLRSKDGSIQHTGDNLTGAGDGDDEVINVDLPRVPATVKTLVFTVNSFRGQTFDRVQNAFCRVVDRSSNQEIAIYKLSTSGSHTGMIVAKAYRHNGEWKFAALGTPCNGSTIDAIMPAIRAAI